MHFKKIDVNLINILRQLVGLFSNNKLQKNLKIAMNNSFEEFIDDNP